MKTIAIFTTTRAEFGILLPLIKQIEKDKSLQYLLFAGGTHLTKEQGKTIEEIKNNCIVTDTFDYLLNDDTPLSLSKSAGRCSIQSADIFNKYKFDYICVLGDRWELLSIVQCAIIFIKPIIHIHGGEITKGAIDNQIRNMITKAAHLHFVASEDYANNIKNMDEEKWRIFNTGALCVDNICNNKKISKNKLFKELNLDINKKTVLLTYHPVTIEYRFKPLEQIQNLFYALEKFDLQIMITSPNIEVGRDNIEKYIINKVTKNKNYYYIKSLGVIKYHSLIPHCEFVIGNSSSGIIEVPYFKIPTVNIGDRQKGRLKHQSIIDTSYSCDSIVMGIQTALDSKFKNKLKNMKYKFGNGKAAEKMIKILKSIKINEKLMRK